MWVWCFRIANGNRVISQWPQIKYFILTHSLWHSFHVPKRKVEVSNDIFFVLRFELSTWKIDVAMKGFDVCERYWYWLCEWGWVLAICRNESSYATCINWSAANLNLCVHAIQETSPAVSFIMYSLPSQFRWIHATRTSFEFSSTVFVYSLSLVFSSLLKCVRIITCTQTNDIYDEKLNTQPKPNRLRP